ELKRVLAELREANERLVIAGVRMQEMTEQAERRRLEAETAAAAAAVLYEALQTANRIKDEFLATLSHELRTPLSAILGWSRILSYGAPLTKLQQLEGIAAIDRNARAQVHINDDLLDV